MDTPADNDTAPADGGGHFAARALKLALLAAVLTAGLATLAQLTHERIARNEQAWIGQHLDALIDRNSRDNDPLRDVVSVVAPELAGPRWPTFIYRARRGGRPVAAAIRTVAPDGYHGQLELLVAITHDGRLLGVQVIRHQETPGLGDAFARDAGRWLGGFRGLSLANPPLERWTVKRDAGDFDAFTGATITPRAIVKAVRRALEYHEAHRDRIFSEQP